MAAKYPLAAVHDIVSSHSDVYLCIRDQQNAGLCLPCSCSNFHICRDYLLTSRCSEFELNGTCSHSHSLFTRHNQNILKKLKLSPKDEETFGLISDLIRTSEDESSRAKRSSVPDDDRAVELRNKETSLMNSERDHDRRSLPPPGPTLSKRMSFDNQSSANEKRSSFSTRLSSTNNSSPRDMFSKSTDFSAHPKRFTTTRSVDLSDNQFDQRADNKQNPNIMHSSRLSKHEDENDRSPSPDGRDENNNTSSLAAKISRHGKAFTSVVRGYFGGKKEKHLSHSHPNDTVTSGSRLKYVFDKYSKDDQVSYLFGPTRRYLNERTDFKIFSSGYCRFTSMDEEEELEQILQRAIPKTLKTDHIQLPNDDLAFFISTSAAEKIFEQNQITYSIISEPYTASFSVEVVRQLRDDHARSISLSPRKGVSTRLPNAGEKPPLPIPNGKFRILGTNSSIDLIYGDITEVKVDLMVCITTSITLLKSVLSKAGSSITSQYDQQLRSQKPVLLGGGSTSARNILFIPWKLEVESSNTREAQNSLLDLVTRCIQRALESKMTSIAFPSIGTGQIGLDPHKVCEAMINAAIERLHKYQIDVSFVIYPSSGSGQTSYQIFRTYLADLCKRDESIRAETLPISHAPQSSTTPVERSQQIERDVECRRVSTVSDLANSTPHHSILVRLLENLIEEKTLYLSLVQKPLVDQIELLIDICLGYHVLPRIDFVKGDLILRGDSDSCSQCIANLQKRSSIHKYSIYKKTAGENDEIKLNMYVSMKIDEGITNEESKIRIQDDDETIFRIDLRGFQVQINDDVKTFTLCNELLSDSKNFPPKSWSSTSMIRTVELLHRSYDSLEFVHAFERTMSESEWDIERIHAIENWPLYVHYSNKKTKDDTIAFHGCPFSSVQSIIHYGLHSNHSRPPENSIRLTRNALDSHIRHSRRSTGGKYYMFVVQFSKKLFNTDPVILTNETAHLALPTHLFVYQRKTVV